MTAPTDTCPSCLASLPSDSLHCPSCGAATPTHGAAAASPGGGSRRQQLADALGDNYIVGDLIGRGGFADVYRVADLELQRDIAVKVLRSDFSPSEEMAERFKRETQAVARLRHPGIIQIYSVGKAGELLYFTMPLIEGETLRDRLAREKRLPVDEVLRILRETASALETAHRAGLVHRDIKPENIMLEGPQQRVLIMDFGIAKAAEAQMRRLTQTGMVIGTPQYMSPEQTRGDKGIDSRSDIYSLGVMTYQMLSGVRPFKGSNLPQIIMQHALYQPPELATLRSGLPPALADMVHRCLNKNKDERWSSVTELLAELDLEFGPRIDERLTTSLSVEVPADLGEIKRGEWVALSTVGAIGLIGLLTSLAFRPAPIDRPPSFERADSIANAYLASRASGAYEQARAFVQRDSQRSFLVEAVGRDEARRIASEDVAISFWRFKWYRPGRSDTWFVEVGGDSLIHGFERPLEETVEGASLSPDSAQAIANSFLTAMGWDLSTLEVLGTTTERRPSRTDHRFEWDDPGSVVEATDENGTRRARERISIVVSGEEVTNYHHFLSVDDESGGGMDAAVIIIGVFLMAIVLISIGALPQILRRCVVNWRHPIAVAAFASILLLIGEANAFNPRFGLPAGSISSSLLEESVVTLVALIAGAALILILAGASLVLPRKSATRALIGYETMFTRSWDRDTLRKVLLVGYGAGLAMALSRGLHNFGFRFLPSADTNLEALGMMDSHLPWLGPILGSLGMGLAGGVFGLIAVGFLARFVKPPFVVAIIVAIGLMIDVATLADGSVPEFICWFFLVAAITLLRFGAVALMIAVFVSSILGVAGDTIASGVPDVFVLGIIAFIAVGLPAAVAPLGVRRKPGN